MQNMAQQFRDGIRRLGGHTADAIDVLNMVAGIDPGAESELTKNGFRWIFSDGSEWNDKEVFN